MTAAIEALASESVSPIYAMNFDGEAASIPSLLKDVPYHIAPGTNRFTEPSPCINVPSFYLSGPVFFVGTSGGQVPGLLQSCSLEHRGRGKALVVH